MCTLVMLASSGSSTDTDTPSPSGSTDTGADTDTGAVLDRAVTARDGTTRSCTDLVVFCDVPDANQAALDSCIDRMEGVVNDHQHWQGTLLYDSTLVFNQGCGGESSAPPATGQGPAHRPQHRRARHRPLPSRRVPSQGSGRPDSSLT